MSTTRVPLDRSAAATGFLVVVLANFLYLTGLWSILDPMMAMEPLYIEMARQPVSSILGQDPAWGPVYALWLKPFRALLGDPVAVYAANVYGLSSGVSILVYLYLLLLTRRAAAAVGAAVFFLICDLNVPLSSKVTGFALMVLLAGLTVSELVPSGARRTSVAAAGMLIASHARPEFYPAALCMCLAALWFARTELSESGWRVVLWPATAAAAVLIPAFWIGTPLFSPYHSGDRLLMAFREHFAWNWNKWHNPGQGRYFLSIWEQEFGSAQTTLEALLENPAAVIRHVGDNLIGTLSFMGGSAFDHYPLLVPATYPTLVKGESLLVSAAVFGSLVLVAVRPRLRRRMLERYGHVLLPYATIAVFSLAAAIAIFPLAHYLVIPSILLMLAGTLAATLIVPAQPVQSWRTRAVAALACLIAVPRPFILPSAYVVSGSPFKARLTVARTVTDTIEFIRSLPLSAPVQVLTLTDGIGEMLGTGFREVKVWQKGSQPLQTYLQDKQVDVIVSMEQRRQNFVLDDPYWQLVQDTPEAAGFVRLSVPNHEAVSVYVRTDLIKADSPYFPLVFSGKP